MSMFEIVAVTNRRLCAGNFLNQLEQVAGSGVSRIILREKDLPLAGYMNWAEKAQQLCGAHGVIFIPHYFLEAAARLHCDYLHLPLAVLEAEPAIAASVPNVGVSVHSIEQAHRAVRLGASYLIAGHIFPTDCKKDLAPRGLAFLHELCESVSVPVYAIGGISPENIRQVRKAGAAGACVMSGLMKTADAAGYVHTLQQAARSSL